MSTAHIQQSQGVDWGTPKIIVDAVLDCFGGLIDLDPSSNDNPYLVDCTRKFKLPQVNGLTQDWALPGRTQRVYCNPPYGTLYFDKDNNYIGPKERAQLNKLVKKMNEGDIPKDEAIINKLNQFNIKYSIKDWVKKAILENQKDCEIIMLVPAALDTKHFQDEYMIFDTCTSICYPKGRLEFINSSNRRGQKAPMCVCLIYWGNHHQHFEKAFNKIGRVFLINK